MKCFFKSCRSLRTCRFVVFICLLILSTVGCSRKSATVELDPPATPERWMSEQYEKDRYGVILEADKELKKYLERTVSKNFSLQVVAMNLKRVGAMHKVVGADMYPQFDIGFDGTRGENSLGEDGSVSAKRHEPYLTASWEIDLWGKLKDRTLAASSEYKASKAEYRAAHLSITSQIAKAWYQAIADKLLYDQAVEVAKSFRSTLEAVEERYQAGLIEGLEVYMAKTAVSNALTSVESSRVTKKHSLHFLQILSGGYPDGQLQLPDALVNDIPSIPAGLPANMVNQRPDLIAARTRVEAADYSWNASLKELLPSITLSGRGGFSSSTIGDAFSADYGLWQLAAGITQPLFYSGKLQAQASEAEFKVKQVQLEYCHKLLEAFGEVEDALSSDLSLRKQYQQSIETVHVSEMAWLAAIESYQAGSTDLLTVLLTQRQFLESKKERVMLHNGVLQNTLELVVALGRDLVGQAQ